VSESVCKKTGEPARVPGAPSTIKLSEVVIQQGKQLARVQAELARATETLTKAELERIRATEFKTAALPVNSRTRLLKDSGLKF